MLFDIPNNNRVEIELPLITDNYTVLFFDEFPMLFTGTNENGERIVGSLMCEDEKNDIIRYAHLLVNNDDYLDFIRKKISYRVLIERQKTVFLVDRNDEDIVVNTYCVPPRLIPGEFLPHKDLLCPNTELVVGNQFTFSFKGGIADIHEAITDAVSKVSKNSSKILNSLVDGFKLPQIIPTVRQLAYSPTSFGINFRVVFNSGDIFFNSNSEAALNVFVSSTLKYSLTHLNEEAQQLADNNLEGTQYEDMVIKPLQDAFSALHMNLDDKTKEKVLINIKKIPFELEKMSDELGQGFTYLEVKSYNSNNNLSESIGKIDKDFANELSIATEILEKADAVIEQDDDFKDYKIHVYHLNIETRNGNAHVNYLNDNEKQITDNPKIKILGNQELAGSVFIDSMDTGETISIKGKAKKVNGRFKSITIEFD